MLKIEYQGQFKKDYKLAIKRGCDLEEFKTILSYLVNEKPLPDKYRDHALANTKEFKNVRECHVQPDWLLIYKICEDRLVLTLIRTGTHSDLF